MTTSPRAADGRLLSRPRTAHVGEPYGPGVHELAGSAQLLVPEHPSGALLVWLHGAGGDGRRSLPAVAAAAGEHGVLVLAPTSAASTWDLVVGAPGADVAALDDLLAGVLDVHPVERIALGGFSDGASYALSLGLANGDLAEALLAFSPGFAAPPQTVGRPRVYVAHGTADAVLPVDRCGRRVVRLLTDAGYAVRYDEFEGAHVVRPQDVAAAFGWWLG